MDGHKASLGAGSANLTYSTIANVPKAKRQKLINEAKPMVGINIKLTVSNYIARWCKKVKRYLERYKKG
jgi:hypothetical protein